MLTDFLIYKSSLICTYLHIYIYEAWALETNGLVAGPAQALSFLVMLRKAYPKII